jgi:probable F420-dependent oxidoreductase
VKVYAGMDPRLPLAGVPAYARRVEAMGFDGVHVAETVHDSLAVCVLVAEHTQRLTIRTSVALAFVRSPTLTAYAAWDLARLSGGRFELGLGTQIRQNIEERMGMAWSAPVPRLREYVAALGALYESFRTGAPPHHEGSSYRITRLQPYFNPGPDPTITPPPTWLGGVNAAICRLAGEVAAGFVTHPTNSDPRYLTEICLPNLMVGAARAGRSRADFQLVVGAPIITGATDAGVATERERQRRLLAMLYSTPAYQRTLELYGWAEVMPRLQALIRADRWDALGEVIDDDVLDALVPSGRFDQIGALLLYRYGGLADGLLLGPQPDPAHDGAVAALVTELQGGQVQARARADPPSR